jgi:transcriptional regulator with XRE-family HTH domain
MGKIMLNGETAFGQWLRQRRRSLDFTQIELARRVGCSAVSIRKFESGERRPSRQVAELIAMHVGIAPDERTTFLQFARTDSGAPSFRHPLLSDVIPPIEEDAFPSSFPVPTDFMHWIEMCRPEAPIALAQKVLTMHFESAAIAPSTSEILADNRMLCKIQAAGRLTGDLSGHLRQDIVQLSPRQSDSREPLVPTTTQFIIETADGVVKGYCTGFFSEAQDGTYAKMQQHGQVLSVTAAYADLFAANVFYRSEIPLVKGAGGNEGSQDRGTLTIAPR